MSPRDELVVVHFVSADRLVKLKEKQSRSFPYHQIVSWLLVLMNSNGFHVASVRLCDAPEPKGQVLGDFIRKGEDKVCFTFDVCSSKAVKLNKTTQLFPKQQEVAIQLYQTALRVLNSSRKTLTDQYDDVEYLVGVPSRSNLVNQTKQRMTSLGLQPNVIMYLENGEHPKRMEEFLNRVVAYPRTLFVFIADECHWGINKDSASSSFLNNETICNSHNVLLLCVSATPFNILTRNSRVPFVFEFLEDFSSDLPKGTIFRATDRSSDEKWIGYTQSVPNVCTSIPISFLLTQRHMHIVHWMNDVPIQENGLEHISNEKEKKYHRLEWFIRAAHENGNLRTEHRFNHLVMDQATPHIYLAAEYCLAFLFYRYCVLTTSPNVFWEQTKQIYKWELPLSLYIHHPKATHSDHMTILQKCVHEIIEDWLYHVEDYGKKGRKREVIRQKLEQKNPKTSSFYYCYTECDRIVELLIKERKMVVVRIKPTEFAVFFALVMQAARKHCSWDDMNGYAVLLNSAEYSLSKSKEVLVAPLIQRANTRKCHRNILLHSKNEKQYLTLEEIEIPCILVVIEVGKFGDTFPSNFQCYDLRVQNISTYLSTFIQLLGRMCKYNEEGKAPYALTSASVFKKILHAKSKYKTSNDNLVHQLDIKIDGKIKAASASKVFEQWNTFLGITQPLSSYDEKNSKAHDRRIVLYAEPQVGKTLSFLWFIELLLSCVCKPNVSVESFDFDACLPEKDLSDIERLNEYPYWKDLCHINSYSEIPSNTSHPIVLQCRYNWLIDACSSKNPWLHYYMIRIFGLHQSSNVGEMITTQKGRKYLQKLRHRFSDMNAPFRCHSDGQVDLLASKEELEGLLNWDGRFNKSSSFNSFIKNQLDTTTNTNTNTNANANAPLNYNTAIKQSFCTFRATKMPSVSGKAIKFCSKDPAGMISIRDDEEDVINGQPKCTIYHVKPREVKEGLFSFPDFPLRFSIPTDLSHCGIDSIHDIFLIDDDGTIQGCQKEYVEDLEDVRRNFWVFTHSDSSSLNKKFLDHSQCFSRNQQRVHVLVVSSEDYKFYHTQWGQTKLILELPTYMHISCFDKNVAYEDGGEGFAKLFIQLMASYFAFSFVWLLDDNILHAEDNREGKKEPCSLQTPMEVIEGLLQDFPLPTSIQNFIQKHQILPLPPDGIFGMKPSRDHSSLNTLWQYSGDILEEFAIIGISPKLFGRKTYPRSWVSTTNIGSFMLLNVHSTLLYDVFFPTKPFWASFDFAHHSHEQHLAVVQCNLFSFVKAYHTLSKNEVRTHHQNKEEVATLYHWNNNTELVMLPQHLLPLPCDSISRWLRVRNIRAIITSPEESLQEIHDPLHRIGFTTVTPSSFVYKEKENVCLLCSFSQIESSVQSIQHKLGFPASLFLIVSLEQTGHHVTGPALAQFENLFPSLEIVVKASVDSFDVWSCHSGQDDEISILGGNAGNVWNSFAFVHLSFSDLYAQPLPLPCLDSALCINLDSIADAKKFKASPEYALIKMGKVGCLYEDEEYSVARRRSKRQIQLVHQTTGTVKCPSPAKCQFFIK